MLIAIWLGVFCALVGTALVQNRLTPDPADHWPPGCVVLFALWPLLVAAGLVAFVVLWISDEARPC